MERWRPKPRWERQEEGSSLMIKQGCRTLKVSACLQEQGHLALDKREVMSSSRVEEIFQTSEGTGFMRVQCRSRINARMEFRVRGCGALFLAFWERRFSQMFSGSLAAPKIRGDFPFSNVILRKITPLSSFHVIHKNVYISNHIISLFNLNFTSQAMQVLFAFLLSRHPFLYLFVL